MTLQIDVGTEAFPSHRHAPNAIWSAAVALALPLLLAACGGGGASGGSAPVVPTPPTTPAVSGQPWLGYGGNAQHTAQGKTIAQGGVAAQNLGHIAWETSVDLVASLSPPIHYGSPMITALNTVLVPVKTSAAGAFRVEAHAGSNGALLWSANSDYVFPAHSWIPSYGPTLTAGNRLYFPAVGGKVQYRDNPDSASGAVQTLVFYGAGTYAGASAAFDANVFIDTPITADASGNIYFGFRTNSGAPGGLVSGIARIGADGTGSWVAANAAIGFGTPVDTAMNATPTVSNDGKTVYVLVRTADGGVALPTAYLVALDSTTLATKNKTVLLDPFTNLAASASDNSTASPVVGPDGDVFIGVLGQSQPQHHYRGWLLHFDATLAIAKTPGSFGWDDTPTVIPASYVTSYTGSSSYLLMTKYNDYAVDGAGNGLNRVAILDPNGTEPDPILANPVMKEVLTLLGPTSDAAAHPNQPNAVKEWCINTAAFDPITHSIFVNSEDGFLYRWDTTTGLVAQKIWLDNGYGQAYTPTLLGPDGTVYSINAASLFAIRN